MGWFSNRKSETPEEMLARFHEDQRAMQSRSASAVPGTGRFDVEDSFNITGRGTIATGKVVSGVIRTGDSVTVCRADGEKTSTTVQAIEMFRKVLTEAGPGELVGLELAGNPKVERGDTITF